MESHATSLTVSSMIVTASGLTQVAERALISSSNAGWGAKIVFFEHSAESVVHI